MPRDPSTGKRTKRAPRRNYDWPAIKAEYSRSRLNLIDFAKAKKIPYVTIRKHMKSTDKDLSGERSTERGKNYREKISAAATEEEAKYYLNALKRSHGLLDGMLEDLAEQWGHEIDYSDAFKGGANEIGRLAVLVSERLLITARELQGIPTGEDDYGWPLTRGFWPFHYQLGFTFALPSTVEVAGKPLFNLGFIGGVGSGKTRCGAEKIGELAWRNRGTVLGVFAPTYRMLEDATKRVFFDVLARKGLSYHHMASDNSILLFGDTKILFRSLDNPEHLRGEELSAAWIDEGGQMKTRRPYDVVAARVRHAGDARVREPLVLHTTTPNGFNWLHTLLVEEAEKNRAVLFHARTKDNLALDPDYAERLEDTYDERYARQELEGQFVDVFVGAAYWNFNRTDSVTKDFDYDEWLPLVLAFDLNVDPMCWNICQTFKATNGKPIDVVIDEIHIRTTSTGETCQEFLRRYGAHKAGVVIAGDATWRHRRSTATTRTDYDVIKAELKEMPAIETRIGKTNPSVTDSIAAVNARLKNRRGDRRLLFHPRCKHTIRDFERVAFKAGTRELDKSNRENTHHSDAVRYWISSEYALRKPVVTLGRI